MVFFILFFLFTPLPPLSQICGDKDWPTLMWTAKYSHDTIIPLLLEADAQIDAQDIIGRTPLIWASMKGKEAAVRELLKGNPNLDLKNNDGKTALDWAREDNYQSIVDLLVDHKRS